MRHFLYFNGSVRAACAARTHRASRLAPVASITAIKFVSAVLERGSYPFPFRTRQSSLPSPMVPGLRARESRAPLDSRPPEGKPSGGLFFIYRSTSLRSRDHDSSIRVACRSQPLERKLEGPFFFYTENVILSVLSMTLVRVSNSYPLWMECRNSR